MPVVRSHDLEFTQLPGRLSADPLLQAGRADDPSAGYSARVVRVAPGPRTPHRHPHSDELTFVLSGTGNAWEGDTSTAVAAGDLIVVPRDVPHATVATGTAELVLLCFFPHPELSSNIVELDGPVRH